MQELITKMKADMEIRSFSPLTVKHYSGHVDRFARYFNKSLELLGEDKIHSYLHYCITKRQMKESSSNYVYSALKFFYQKTMGHPWNVEKLPRIKEGRKLPVVLSQSEVTAIFDSTDNLKHQAILQILVKRGKGKKDRYSLLSKTNLEVLRNYWKRYRPQTYVTVKLESADFIK